MPHSPRDTACIQLTPDQVEAIRRQTGLNDIPGTLSISVDHLMGRRSTSRPATQGQDAEFGLIHEPNRI